MDADNGSVDHLDRTIMTFGESFHDAVPNASCSSANEALRQIAPWCAGVEYRENAVEDTSVVDPRHASGLVRQKGPDGSPLKVREFISHDSRLRFGSLNHAYSEVRNVELAGPR